MVGLTRSLETLGDREPPPDDGLDRILRRFDERRRRRRIGGLVVGLAAALVVVVVGTTLMMRGGPAPGPGATSPSEGNGSPSPVSGNQHGVYRDPAGWSLRVPRGWKVTPFRSSAGGVTGAGAQFSNVGLPAPRVVGWAPLQADGRSFPGTAIALVVGTQQGGRVQRFPVAGLPISYPDGWAAGSSFGNTPTLDTIWFRGGGHVFVATVKTGQNVTPADRRALERMVESIRFGDGISPTPTPTPTPAATATSGPDAPLRAEIVLPTTTIAAGSSVEGSVIVHNHTGSAIQVSGCGTIFAVALGNDDITPTVVWPDCLQPFTIPIGSSTWPVTVAASYLGCNGGPPAPPCVNGHVPPLPVGSYRAMLYQISHVVPTPPAVDVLVTP